MSRKGKIKIASPDEVDELVGNNDGSPDSEPADAPSSESDPAAQIAELKDRLLRAKAELQNLQRRSRTEVEQAARYANANFAKGIVEMIDNFDRTLEAAHARNATVESVTEGVTLIRDAFLKVLTDQGVKTVVSQGKPFDPHVHEAVMQQPSDEHPDQTILQEVQKGYTLFDRVLRPAKVIVSKATPAPNATTQQNDPEEPSAE